MWRFLLESATLAEMGRPCGVAVWRFTVKTPNSVTWGARGGGGRNAQYQCFNPMATLLGACTETGQQWLSCICPLCILVRLLVRVLAFLLVCAASLAFIDGFDLSARTELIAKHLLR